jgi:hypothetical protein
MIFEAIAIGLPAMGLAAFTFNKIFHEDPHSVWFKQRYHEGASSEEIQRESTMRLTMAQMRRQVSDAVLQRPGDAEQIRAEATEHAAYLVGRLHGTGAGKQFAAVCAGLHERDILYPDALAAARAADPIWQEIEAEAKNPQRYDHVAAEDYRAAFTDLR